MPSLGKDSCLEVRFQIQSPDCAVHLVNVAAALGHRNWVLCAEEQGQRLFQAELERSRRKGRTLRRRPVSLRRHTGTALRLEQA